MGNKIKIKVCECCNNKQIYGNNKWCSSCAIYIKEMKRSLRYYKSKSDKLNKILYGQKNGAERVRLFALK